MGARGRLGCDCGRCGAPAWGAFGDGIKAEYAWVLINYEKRKYQKDHCHFQGILVLDNEPVNKPTTPEGALGRSLRTHLDLVANHPTPASQCASRKTITSPVACSAPTCRALINPSLSEDTTLRTTPSGHVFAMYLSSGSSSSADVKGSVGHLVYVIIVVLINID